MATFAHELSHLLGIGDNYNNPFSDPARRSYTGPWSMLSRGSFNGPGGPHTRWQIPPLQGASMGSLHTVRDKHQIQLIDDTPILQISRAALAESGPVVAELTARSVDPGTSGIMGFNISFDAQGDLSPACNVTTDPFCDGGRYNNYNLEVIDRMGADSFCPDSGVMISKTKNSDRQQPFQWTIDANPQDIEVIDFYLPNGTARYLTIGDYRQLADALFHAGTRSGSEFEHVDEPNGLHMYIIDTRRDNSSVLHYTVGVRALAGSGASKYGVELSEGTIESASASSLTGAGVFCSFSLENTGAAANSTSAHPQNLSAYLGSDIYRLSAEIDFEGWRVELPNALAAAKFGEKTTVKVAVGAGEGYLTEATVSLTATSESDPSVKTTKTCTVSP
ncbi:hypothetical protein BS50DRAFT_570320 [Corynespora cassiicola Philippines]|uniref:Uncharacterized protein n=1 Tax=Corynespora cassiicola Philippines TaxID=1448308 RepID=A0A2T2P0I4_CORCC|nr:hypothetical protein BS50DRAFT_570320 [Corynespora cassiicola Philippines]